MTFWPSFPTPEIGSVNDFPSDTRDNRKLVIVLIVCRGNGGFVITWCNRNALQPSGFVKDYRDLVVALYLGDNVH